MAGYGYDTSTLTLAVTLDDGSEVQITGANDGVNGYEWSAVHALPGGPVPIAVDVREDVLIDGITEATD